jgi:hypothetical protein
MAVPPERRNFIALVRTASRIAAAATALPVPLLQADQLSHPLPGVLRPCPSRVGPGIPTRSWPSLGDSMVCPVFLNLAEEP